MTLTPDTLAALRQTAEAVATPLKWYTTDELLKRRAMPEADGNLIAALPPPTVLQLLDLADEVVRLRADSTYQGKLILKLRDVLVLVRDGISDEGDRVYFGR